MRPSSFLVLAVLVILGALAVHAAVVGVPHKSQEVDHGHVVVQGHGHSKDHHHHPGKGKGPGKNQGAHKFRSKPGACPEVLIRCAMLHPPNSCLKDSECPGAKKCCEGSCGKACLNPR
ncbi:elafin [Pteronotus mesoamericanus]|uniref:elafin n=1 Tax=Pteronotus mesoamericanus TaxID=1884717 RepID=UPI0023EC1CEF|nr:elafin [Pteronotus parnellii mesoamericanus]